MELSGTHVAPTYRLDDHIAKALRADGRRIVITGASGWLGLATLEMLHDALGDDFADRVACFGSQARTLILRNGFEIRQLALSALAALSRTPTFVLHLAYLTKDRAEDMDAEAYRAANRALSQTVLDALEPIGADAIFLPSSGAAAVADLPSANEAMRAYGLLKREDEEIFAGWAEHSDKLAVIARVFNVSGPYINKPQNYALASFIIDALAGRPVVVKAQRRVVRSYVAIRELMSLGFGLLMSDREGAVRFDTASDEELEMRQIGQQVADIVGDGALNAEKLSEDLVPDIYVGERTLYETLRRSVGVKAVPFSTQVKETAAYLAAATA